MALNRRQRRARKDRRPHAGDTPQQQMRDFLRAPGKLHIVQLPDEKSFVVKVTEREMPLFLTICQQLKAVLGQCDAIPATPVDASVADAQTIARQTANDPQRIADAQRRQNEYEQARAGQDAADELEASIARHPAGRKRSGGRHAKPEPDTTFDKFAATEDKVRAASIELAAAQDAAARAQEAADAANARLADVYERSGEIHNQRVLGAFTEAAGQAIAEHTEQPDTDDPYIPRAWSGDGPYIEARAETGPGSTPIYPQYDVTGPGKMTIDDGPAYVPGVAQGGGGGGPKYPPYETVHEMTCPRDNCGQIIRNANAVALAKEYAGHIADHARADTALSTALNTPLPRGDGPSFA